MSEIWRSLNDIFDGVERMVEALFGDGFWVLWAVIVTCLAFFAWLP